MTKRAMPYQNERTNEMPWADLVYSSIVCTPQVSWMLRAIMLLSSLSLSRTLRLPHSRGGAYRDSIMGQSTPDAVVAKKGTVRS